MDGEPFHPPSRAAEDHKRDGFFLDHGVWVHRFDSNECYKYPDEVVRRFLERLNDLALFNFLQVLEWVAKKKGKQVIYIDPWYPSSKTCSCCGNVLDELDLSVRRWRCPSCHQVNDRDTNAALNIKHSRGFDSRRRRC